MLAPICLFTYNRFNETRQTIEALQNNFLAKKSDLIIFSDGGKDAASQTQVEKVRQYLRTVTGFKSIQIIESPINKGLANSIITGVTQIIEQYGKVIVLEDDLITSRNFLDYMNQCLDFYENEPRVLSISGFSYSFSLPRSYKYDMALGYRASSWGWATWKNRWDKVDWDIESYHSFKYNLYKRLKFNRGGSDMSVMLDRHISKKINSWAICFSYHQYVNNLLDVYPVKSKIQNIGFSSNATNSVHGAYRFRTKLDTSSKRNFTLQKEIRPSKLSLLKFYWRNFYFIRILDRFLK